VEYETDADRGSDEYSSWRKSDRWQKWNAAIAPAVAARRQCIRLLGNKEAVGILFDEVAPRFVDRPGGYTRIVRLAKPRLGDAGTQAILEFVGVRDRVIERSVRPAFDDTENDTAETRKAPTSADSKAEADDENADQ
jgi:large subunit ribosomal protein L17